MSFLKIRRPSCGLLKTRLCTLHSAVQAPKASSSHSAVKRPLAHLPFPMRTMYWRANCCKAMVFRVSRMKCSWMTISLSTKRETSWSVHHKLLKDVPLDQYYPVTDSLFHYQDKDMSLMMNSFRYVRYATSIHVSSLRRFCLANGH
jgi:hypothetical protein